MIWIDGDPVTPSFRVGRGELKMDLSATEASLIMNPYDIVQKLAESGEINQAFAALNGFLRREIDIWGDAAIERMYK